MTKKLLVVGNSSIHIFNFIELVKDYFDDVLLLTDRKNESWNIDTIEVDFGLRINGFKNYKNLKKIINDFNPSTVHIHQVNIPALLTLLALKGNNTQTVLTAWGSDILLTPKKSIFLKWIVKYILNSVDIITADSDTVLLEANKLTNKKLNTYNINFGIEIPYCTMYKENIIYSNRLHKELYNIDKIILSFHKFLKLDPSWKLVIAGNGEDSGKLKNLVKTLNITNSVEFIGWVDTKTNFEYYCKSKIYASIPNSDSISISLVESIASNCIVFVSDLPANREIVTSDIGFIVKDLENIDFALFKTINNQYYQDRRDIIIKQFSKEHNKSLYISLYENSNL
ncbi:hypothetical protein TSL6_18040 [Sulfurovum sp. TSL6]|uniref:glycosyltransferase n=1 Tax=Sulfurovum sp. TSL6 TaxID=2826995 RepID=UPI001CC3822D|nr:glycosyltransferase [Sulfurovum sp. TSL6]GIU01298.1 hypothetical protein TSL6_18040 [Sulfurovum sp. TSL6]